MANRTAKQVKQAKKRGPKRIEYIPAALAGIAGAEGLTTVRQLERLLEYLQTPAETRAPFVRLGASVPARKAGKLAAPSATYAVDVDGKVSVIRREGDPRLLHKWATNGRRPWNLCRDPRFVMPTGAPVNGSLASTTEVRA